LKKSPVKRNATERSVSSSFLDNRRSSAETKSFLTQDFSTQSFNDNVVYEIGPKGGNGFPLPKGPENNAGKDRTPDRKHSSHHEPVPNLRIPGPEKRTTHKYPDLASARDTLSSARGHSRRSVA